MRYRRLGKTELEISQISFGGIKLGNLSQEKVTELLNTALDSGMNYIDTARVYGTSEEKVGNAIKDGRDEVILSTKVLTRDFEEFKRDFATSFEKLQIDYIDIFFIHDVSTQQEWDQIQENGVIDFVQQQKEAGVIKHLAFSTHSLNIGKQMIESDLFEAVMVAYNVANTDAEDEFFALAKSHDLGIIIMKPFGGGILTEVGSEQLGFEITAEDSLTFAASHPDITAVIPGIDKMEYLETALKVAETPLELTDAEKKAITDKVQIGSEYYCRGCGYCLPCPEGLEIPTILKLYNRWEAFQGVNWAQMHMVKEEYNELKKLADKCVACDKCNESCPYSLPISDLMEKMAAAMG